MPSITRVDNIDIEVVIMRMLKKLLKNPLIVYGVLVFH